MLHVILLILGVVLVVWGADRLIDGASDIARRFGVSELVVGLTIVAFGTSLPEFVVSLFSAVNGQDDLSVGNIVGSNMVNTLIIVGAAALVLPIKVSRGTVSKDIPFVLAATLLMSVAALDDVFGTGGPNVLSRADGIAMLILFLVFMRYTFSLATSGAALPEAGDEAKETKRHSAWWGIGWSVVGLTSLVVGGRLFVDNASEIALMLGMSEMMVGLTIAAVGTSLPELVTTIMAAYKGHSDMAIGNVIGSIVFNILFVLGVCCTVTPLGLKSVSPLDWGFLLGGSLLFWLFAHLHRKIVRWEGAVLVIVYIVYMILKINEQDNGDIAQSADVVASLGF